MALQGTTHAPHFDRTAFKVARIYVTLAADGRSANLKLTHEEQALKCLTAPAAFQPVPNKWGNQGWTTATLAALGAKELEAALELAWRHAVPDKPAPLSRRMKRKSVCSTPSFATTTRR